MNSTTYGVTNSGLLELLESVSGGSEHHDDYETYDREDYSGEEDEASPEEEEEDTTQEDRMDDDEGNGKADAAPRGVPANTDSEEMEQDRVLPPTLTKEAAREYTQSSMTTQGEGIPSTSTAGNQYSTQIDLGAMGLRAEDVRLSEHAPMLCVMKGANLTPLRFGSDETLRFSEHLATTFTESLATEEAARQGIFASQMGNLASSWQTEIGSKFQCLERSLDEKMQHFRTCHESLRQAVQNLPEAKDLQAMNKSWNERFDALHLTIGLAVQALEPSRLRGAELVTAYGPRAAGAQPRAANPTPPPRTPATPMMGPMPPPSEPPVHLPWGKKPEEEIELPTLNRLKLIFQGEFAAAGFSADMVEYYRQAGASISWANANDIETDSLRKMSESTARAAKLVADCKKQAVLYKPVARYVELFEAQVDYKNVRIARQTARAIVFGASQKTYPTHPPTLKSHRRGEGYQTMPPTKLLLSEISHYSEARAYQEVLITAHRGGGHFKLAEFSGVEGIYAIIGDQAYGEIKTRMGVVVRETRKPAVNIEPEQSVLEVPQGPGTTAERRPPEAAVAPLAKTPRKKTARGARPQGDGMPPSAALVPPGAKQAGPSKAPAGAAGPPSGTLPYGMPLLVVAGPTGSELAIPGEGLTGATGPPSGTPPFPQAAPPQ